MKAKGRWGFEERGGRRLSISSCSAQSVPIYVFWFLKDAKYLERCSIRVLIKFESEKCVLIYDYFFIRHLHVCWDKFHSD